MAITFSLKEDKETGEVHIFEGTRKTATTCTPNKTSICGETQNKNGIKIDNRLCLNEEEARYKAAEIGREACGVCVSHLYKTKDIE